MAAFLPSTPSSKVKLYIQCHKLRDMDAFSKSDPVCELSIKGPAGNWIPVGRTEMQKNNLNPVFKKTFSIDFIFEKQQYLLFRVFDVDDEHAALEKNDFLGSMECTVGEIIGAVGQRVVKPLKDKNGLAGRNGTIAVTAEEESSAASSRVIIDLAGVNLAKKDFFGKSDPYCIFYRKKPDGTLIQTLRTETIKNTLNPTWRTIETDTSILCNGDFAAPIRIEVWDYDATSKDDRIGHLDVSLENIILAADSKSHLKLTHPKNKPKAVGDLVFSRVVLHKTPSFIDFLKGGCEINVIFAVDFTASNGVPSRSDSLHYMNPHGFNEYQTAIISVGEILANYDHDKLFPVYGFGAKFPDGRVSHCFSLNGNQANPYCAGIAGVLESYAQALRAVELFGPTNFAEVIQLAARTAAQSNTQQEQKYVVLLILTDGEITDMAKTVESIVKASSLPLSIVIVGVGSADFDRMRELDGDEVLLQFGGMKAERDIVQFVEFRKFSRDGAALAAEVLAEIPTQLMSYMQKRGFTPNPPLAPPPVESVPVAVSAPPPAAAAGGAPGQAPIAC